MIAAVAFAPRRKQSIEVEGGIYSTGRSLDTAQRERDRINYRSGGKIAGDIEQEQGAGAATLPATARRETGAITEIVVWECFLKGRVSGGMDADSGSLRELDH